MCQGIAVGGERGGGALGAFALGTISALLPQDEFLAWGWRVPFLLTFVLLIIGLVIRAKISESPVFVAAAAQAEASGEKQKLPTIEVLRRPRALLLTMFAGASGFGMLTSTNWFVLPLAFTIALGLYGMIYGPLGAGFTPTILATLYAGPGGGTSIVQVAVFLGSMAVVSVIALLLTRESKDHDLVTHEH